MRLWRKPAGVAKKRDPPRRFVRDNIGALIDPNGRFEYLALYGMDFSAAPAARRFSQAGRRAPSRLVAAVTAAVRRVERNARREIAALDVEAGRHSVDAAGDPPPARGLVEGREETRIDGDRRLPLFAGREIDPAPAGEPQRNAGARRPDR